MLHVFVLSVSPQVSGHQYHPEDGDTDPERLKKFYTLTPLSAREDFTEFCLRESFKTKTGAVGSAWRLRQYCQLPDKNFRDMRGTFGIFRGI